MGRFTPYVQYETEFDGDKVKCTMKRLTNAHMLVIAPIFTANENKSAMEKTSALLHLAPAVLTESIISFEGLTTADGAPIKMEDALKELYFAPLFDRILGRLLEASTIGEEDAKKSQKPLPEGSSAELPPPIV